MHARSESGVRIIIKRVEGKFTRTSRGRSGATAGVARQRACFLPGTYENGYRSRL